MGYLYDIAQQHLDAYGVRAAALAKRMGTSPQTLDSWKHREPKRLPEKWLLEALAWETRTSYGVVLTAALRDIDYLPKEREHGGHTAAIAAETVPDDAMSDLTAEELEQQLRREASQQPPPESADSGPR